MLATSAKVSRPIQGDPFEIGTHFSAKNFQHSKFEPRMNPLLMVDHFRMRAPTFGKHPHAGISAVTYLFEDSKSPHMNWDILGNELPITPGSLHWLVAGKGVIHDEWPGGVDPEVHGLQFFVNLPLEKKHVNPSALHLESVDIPVFEDTGRRVRIVTGEFGEHVSPVQLPQSFTLLDGFLARGAELEIPGSSHSGAWIYAVHGDLHLQFGDEQLVLREGAAVSAADLDSESVVRVKGATSSHFIWMCGDEVHA
jgi:redox-sensitive bicupin YhaK (pirin superfamily)